MSTHTDTLPPSYWRLSIGTAVFGLLIMAVPLAAAPDARTTLGVLAMTAIWSFISYADRREAPWGLLMPTEAVLVGIVCGAAGTTPLLAALAVAPFRSGLRRGFAGFVQCLLLELATLTATAILVFGELHKNYVVLSVSWVLIAVGLGLIASFHRATTQPPDPLSPYQAAQSLLRALLNISGDLSTSLDAVSLGNSLVEVVRGEVPVTAVGVLVPREDTMTPLSIGTSGVDVDDAGLTEVAMRSWRAAAPQVQGQAFAFPLMSEGAVVAVVAGLLPTRLDPQDLVISGQLAELTTRLEITAVQLETALLFSRLRDAATADERRRLAREIHDGVAQDIASLGYIVDALVAAPANPQQAKALQMLRQRITDVVAEVRRSVQTLRTDAGASESLGAAVSALARHLGQSSGIPIRVTVDEGTSRLRPEVESELLRIAQEAMNNAVRHAKPTAVDVLVRVAAPSAEIVVRDDGQGMKPGRPDSHGMSIMHERAALVDGELRVDGVFPHGTEVSLRLGAPRDRASVPSEPADGTVRA